MQNRNTINRWLLTAWFLIMGGILAFAYGQRYGSPYRGSSSYYTTISSTQTNATPAYSFQSTSAYAPAIGSSSYTSTISVPCADAPCRVGGMRKSFGDPEDEEVWGVPEGQGYGVGEIADPAPIGGIMPLLLFAFLCIGMRTFVRIRRARKIV